MKQVTEYGYSVTILMKSPMVKVHHFSNGFESTEHHFLWNTLVEKYANPRCDRSKKCLKYVEEYRYLAYLLQLEGIKKANLGFAFYQQNLKSYSSI